MSSRVSVLLLVGWLLFGAVHTASAAEMVEREDLGRYFKGYTGTFVLYDYAKDQYSIYNENQSEKQISPCSSFKIFNSLIALENGVIGRDDADSMIRWNGTVYPIQTWNRDQTLSTAIANSVVWYYQELASRVGEERMQESINRLQYGNCDISGGITRFWLRSSLRISAREQVELLRKLYDDQLPFAPENMAAVRKIIVLSRENGAVLSGKTGSGYQDGKYILGWFVGCVERDGHRYLFAVNIEGEHDAFGGKAKDIATAILRDMQIL